VGLPELFNCRSTLNNYAKQYAVFPLAATCSYIMYCLHVGPRNSRMDVLGKVKFYVRLFTVTVEPRWFSVSLSAGVCMSLV